MSREAWPGWSSALHEVSDEAVLRALQDSDVLATLGMTREDLEMARTDHDLLATLRITLEFLVALTDAGALETFFSLPRPDQSRFLRWVCTTDDRDLRKRLTSTLISAMEAAPLGGISSTDLTLSAEGGS